MSGEVETGIPVTTVSAAVRKGYALGWAVPLPTPKQDWMPRVPALPQRCGVVLLGRGGSARQRRCDQ